MALRRQLDVSYKASWLLKYKLMLYRDFLWSQVLVERNSDFALGGIMPIDDAYLGGERSGGKPGRGSENKQAFVIAVEPDGTQKHPTYAVIQPARTFHNEAIADWAKRRLKPQAEALSDGKGAF
jgi:hypothetical protein